MWVPILICAAAVALLLGPILLMQPSALQRRQAELRQAAIQKGLRIHMAPDPRNPGQDRPELFSVYCLPWQAKEKSDHRWMLIRKNFTHDIHAHGVWDWQEKPSTSTEAFLLPRLAHLLDSLPDGVVSVASGSQGVSCFWNEKGGLDRLEQVYASLSDIKTALMR